jgi:hypothetical protein
MHVRPSLQWLARFNSTISVSHEQTLYARYIYGGVVRRYAKALALSAYHVEGQAHRQRLASCC